MYVIRDHNLGFIAHPKTASSATQRALRECFEVEQFGNHHSVEEGHCRSILASDGIIVSTIRNPFDLFVSWYFHYAQRRGGSVMEPFTDWLPRIMGNPNHYMRQGLFFGLPFTNRVLRYEHLQDDFDSVLEEIDVKPTTIERFNVSLKREGRAYQDMYTPDLIDLVLRHYGPVVEEHGYTFDSS
jgi:hypothetical protein